MSKRKEIERMNEKYPDITILRGIEMDILPDASLDFDDEVLEELDYVIGAIHSSFSQDRETMREASAYCARINMSQ